MVKSIPKRQKAMNGDAVYGLGILGALVYYIQVADGFGPVVFAFIKAAIWPAFLVYDLLKYIH